MRISAPVLVFLMVFGSCSQASMVEKELNAYLLDTRHGMYQSQTKGNIDINVLYKPSRLIWIDEIREAKNQEEIINITRGIDSLSYFIFKFSRNGEELETALAGKGDSYTKVVDYLSYGIGTDLYLVAGKDTTKALDVISTRTYGSGSGNSVIAIFQKNISKNTSDLRLTLNDRVIGTGLTTFTFQNTDLKKIPTLTVD